MNSGSRLKGCIALALLAGIAGPGRAEVSANRIDAYSVSTLLGVIGEGPDPIDPTCWKVIRDGLTGEILNAEGWVRGDGRPDFSWFENGYPFVAWSRLEGPDLDIVYSEWDGAAWTPQQPVATSPGDDLDPRVFVEPGGAVHVAWWKAGTPDAVFYSSRAFAEGAWAPPVRVTTELEAGRRPSVAVLDGVVRVAYERDSLAAGAAQDVVISRLLPTGEFQPEVVARTDRTERLDVILHSEAGSLWLDWKHGADTFGYVEANGTSWNHPAQEPWPSTTWVGTEDVRRTIRRLVRAP